MKQRGFIMPYLAAGGAALSLVLMAVLWFQGGQLDRAKANLVTEQANHKTTKSRYDAFTAGVRKEAEAAAITAELTRKANLKAKEKADEERKRLGASLASAERRLRDAGTRARESASRSILPAGEAAAKRPDRITFDRAELDRALRAYLGETGDILEAIAGLIIEGEKSRVDLDIARRWANEVP